MPLLIFLLIALTSACAVVFLYFVLTPGRWKRADQNSSPTERKSQKRINYGMDLKYYKEAVLIIIFCVEAMLLLPWVLYSKSMFAGTTNILTFIFVISVFIVGHIFILASRELDWKR